MGDDPLERHKNVSSSCRFLETRLVALYKGVPFSEVDDTRDEQAFIYVKGKGIVKDSKQKIQHEGGEKETLEIK